MEVTLKTSLPVHFCSPELREELTPQLDAHVDIHKQGLCAYQKKKKKGKIKYINMPVFRCFISVKSPEHHHCIWQLETPEPETLNAAPQKNRMLCGQGVEEEKGAGSGHIL